MWLWVIGIAMLAIVNFLFFWFICAKGKKADDRADKMWDKVLKDIEKH